MCGRYSLFAPPDDVETRFDAAFAESFEPRYNAAPRQDLPVITDEAPDSIQRMEWGLIPSWAEDRSDFEFINARAETIDHKRSFRDAFAQGRDSEESGGTVEAGRCLVPADGFYEWAVESGGKQPYRVTVGDGDLFAMAGLWARWEPPQVQTGLGDFDGGDPDADAEAVETFTIVTTEPNDLVADLHDRMSVIIAPDEEAEWLTADPDDAEGLLDPYPAAEMDAYPVSTAVNDPANDTPEVVEPIEG